MTEFGDGDEEVTEGEGAAVDGLEHKRQSLPDWVPGCLWWRRQPAPSVPGDRVSMEVAEFLVFGFNADGANVYTVTVEPTMAKVALSCLDTDSGIAWVTREDKAHVFAGKNELVRELAIP